MENDAEYGVLQGMQFRTKEHLNMKRCKTGIYDLAGTCDLKSEAVDTSGQHEDIEKGA